MPLTITDTPMRPFEKFEHRFSNRDNKWKRIHSNVPGLFDEIQQSNSPCKSRSGHSRERICHKNRI